jgi:hypothetical protein
MQIMTPQAHLVKPSGPGSAGCPPAGKPLSYRIEASEPRLTGYGGAGLLAQFLQRLGVPQLLAALPHLPRTRYPAARFLLGLLYGLVLDRSRQAHVAELGDDAVFLQLTGLAALPSQSAFSRFFGRLRAATAHALLETNRALVARVRQGFAGHDTVTLDFDTHVQTCLGRPQRSAVGFNRRRPGARSYKPLYAFVGETRDFVGGRFRAGNAADLAGAQALFDELRRWLKRIGFRGRLQFRADNGFYAGWLLEHLERAGVTYAIVADLYGLGSRLVGLSYRPLDAEYAVAEFRHRAAGWKRARRMIAIRRRLDPTEPKRGKQLKLFEAQGYSWQVIVTNADMPPEAVWRFYNGRCNVENLIKEGRLGLSMDEVCSHSWAANALHNWLALLAGNLLGWFGEYPLGLERRHSIAAVREWLLRIPARLIRTGRQWVLRLSAYYPHLKLFLRAHQRLRAGPIFA